MIKSVLQAIPAYIMNIYLLPDTLTNDIERMINAFWWGGGSDNRGIRWLAWDKLACPKEEGGLGFRDFHNFNMAMVAKQGWNFMHHPTSLVARLYKARYFPKTSFLDSNIGNNPSFAWRSIWRARQVLLLGCRWQIGNGSKISVMNEPWLRENQRSFIDGPQTQNVYSLKVQHLLLPNVKRWDEDKIYSIFSREVAREILAVPLLDLVREDKLIWSEENNGVYSVRTGYRKLMKDKNKCYGPREVGGWSCLWKIHAPPKTKHLLWRICRECLPTRSRLRSRYVQCPEECPLCSSYVEEDFHVFVSCDGVREAWHVMELSNFIQSRLQTNNNMRDFIFDICRHGSDLEASRAAVLLWFIWNNRNNTVWNDSSLSPQQLGVQALVYWQQWAAINGLLHEQQQAVVQDSAANSNTQWIQPPFGFLKCNVDASFYNTAGATGCGWVLRDCRGQFQLAGSNIMMASLSVLEGEAMALIEAMEEVIHRGLSFVIFESDSKLVVDAISSRQGGVSVFSILISHIQALLRFNNYFEVKYVKRQANKVAHSLARAAFSMSRRCVFDSVPPCIDSFLRNEIC
jgi:ribonuclease HI